ncbi:MAG: AI-2E family transporter [Planctomycetota bacterium]
MLQRLSPAKRNAALFVVAALILWFAWTIRSVLNPLLVGYLLAYIALPLVEKIERHGASRRTAVNLTFLGGFLLCVGIGTVLVIQTRSLASDVIKVEPVPIEGAEGTDEPPMAQRDLATRLGDRFEATRLWINERFGFELEPLAVESMDFSAIRDKYFEDNAGDLMGAGSAGIKAAGGVLQFLSRAVSRLLMIAGWFLLVPLYCYYFLFEIGRLHAFVKRYFPRRDRQQLADVFSKIGEVLSNFFRGRLGVSLMKGVLLSLGLALAGIPYAFLFGLVSGFLSLVPFFGPFLGYIACTLVSLAFAERIGGVIPSGENVGVIEVLLRTSIVFGLGELLEGYVLIPKVLGDSLGLHPLVVLFAIFAGGAAFGIMGIVLALPVTASLVIVFREFVLPALQEFADDEDDLVRG